MSLSSIVARRRQSQLATIVPVLFFAWALAFCYEQAVLTSTGMIFYESLIRNVGIAQVSLQEAKTRTSCGSGNQYAPLLLVRSP